MQFEPIIVTAIFDLKVNEYLTYIKKFNWRLRIILKI